VSFASPLPVCDVAFVMRKLVLFVVTFLLVAALPAAASATPAFDRVLDELTGPLDVGIDGPVTAYTRRVGTRGAELVVRNGSRSVRRIPAGRGVSHVDVGRDRRGRRVVVFSRCGARCEVRSLPAGGGRSREIARAGRVLDLSVGAGRAFWTDGRRVRSRALDGGPIRREAVAPGLRPIDLDTDGRTLAVTGDLPFELDVGNGTTGLSVTRPGSGRARLRVVARLMADADGKVTLPESTSPLAVVAQTSPPSYAFYAGR